MSFDRFVYFEKSAPTQEDIQKVLGNFLGGVGTIEWKRDRFFVALPGTPTLASAGFPEAIPYGMRPEERWIEVWYKDNGLDVITRDQDDFTNALASALAEIFARFWKGKVVI